MPNISKHFQLEVTPEQFLKACSSDEIRELQLLLNSKRFDSTFSEESSSDSNDMVSSSESQGELWKELVKLFGDNPTDAILLLKEMKLQSGLSFIEIVRLMPEFKKLEAFRIKALISKPQDQIEE